MRFLRRTTPSAVGPDSSSAPEPASDGGTNTGKGRPTPKRRDAEARRRGPAPPPPRTQREAGRLARANRGRQSDRRRAAAERRERIAAGDQRYLMPRDHGPVRAYVRDVVDSRRHLTGLFMPLAALVFLSILVPVPAVQASISLMSLVMMAAMIIEGVLLGRSITARARARFPGEDIKALGTGWYVFTRASQLRRLRLPRPRVQRGANP